MKLCLILAVIFASMFVAVGAQYITAAKPAIAVVTAHPDDLESGIGTRIIVTNPSPIRWGGADKTDDQLLTHVEVLNRLGAALRELGLLLAYHNHDAELRQGGREFHHMLRVTNPDDVKFCLDAHWIFCGCGDSEVAVFDAVEHYGSRIIELHLRQSRGGVWSEVFEGNADLGYSRLTAWLRGHGLKPQVMLEQAVEKA